MSGTNLALWAHLFTACPVHSMLKTLSKLIAFAQLRRPMLYPKLRNPIQIP
jgi:hypothetical protein